MTPDELRTNFDQVAANLRAAGQLDAATDAELLREWFTNPGFRRWLEDATWKGNALDVDPADWLPVGCPHCEEARAICLEMAGAVWTFQCVACGEVFELRARKAQTDKSAI